MIVAVHQQTFSVYICSGKSILSNEIYCEALVLVSYFNP